MSIWTRLRDLLGPRAEIYIGRPMTDDESEAFDEVFVHFDKTFEAMDELSRRIAANKGKGGA
jgi:hypothetical protein